jgi:hypothetical protein
MIHAKENIIATFEAKEKPDIACPAVPQGTD